MLPLCFSIFCHPRSRASTQVPRRSTRSRCSSTSPRRPHVVPSSSPRRPLVVTSSSPRRPRNTNGQRSSTRCSRLPYALLLTARYTLQLHTTHYGLCATSYELRATGYGLRATGYGLRATGYRLQVTNYTLDGPAAGTSARAHTLTATRTRYECTIIRYEPRRTT
jgi:hypothetical protein